MTGSSPTFSWQGRSVEELLNRKRDLEYALQGMAVEGLALPEKVQEEWTALEDELTSRALKKTP